MGDRVDFSDCKIRVTSHCRGTRSSDIRFRPPWRERRTWTKFSTTGRARGYLLDEDLVLVKSDRDLGPLFDQLSKYNTATFYIEHGEEEHPYWGVDNPVNVVRRHNIPLPPNYALEEEQLQPQPFNEVEVQVKPPPNAVNEVEIQPGGVNELQLQFNEFGGSDEGDINPVTEVGQGQSSNPEAPLYEATPGHEEQVNDDGQGQTEVMKMPMMMRKHTIYKLTMVMCMMEMKYLKI
ncbi:hypothetical protein Tsubulata_036881 [Turnera subulata]|uniref:Uncharacterized protein n=1 Tax=Turnera subulata TaxID=218843 RepID=A0A9Q0G0P5_9ROSI|nr:hypothetical protein Tsubulata_036881 [Turnera subulata]